VTPEGDPTSAIVVPARGPAWQTNAPPRPGWVYSLSKWLLQPVLVHLFKMRFVGRERVPAAGPVVLAGNHRSYMDPLVICMALPRRRPVHFMAKIELFGHSGFFNWLLRQEHGFPVRRGQADREAIKTATDILERGGVVGIFPEGTRVRDGKEAEGQEGAAFVALRSGATIVPVGICGTDRIQPPGDKRWHYVPVTAYFGQPIRPEEFEGARKERLEAMTAAVMDGIEQAKRQADGVVRGSVG
jgi:1-acyl-sn-glycerol-3-phosphate acyltransferase